MEASALPYAQSDNFQPINAFRNTTFVLTSVLITMAARLMSVPGTITDEAQETAFRFRSASIFF